MASREIAAAGPEAFLPPSPPGVTGPRLFPGDSSHDPLTHEQRTSGKLLASIGALTGNARVDLDQCTCKLRGSSR
jgi:hypothetical protein